MERDTKPLRLYTVICRDCYTPIDWNPLKRPANVRMAHEGGWLITCENGHQNRYTSREVQITWDRGGHKG